jgi:hypothetical protein
MKHAVRTTVNMDEDVAQRIRQRMREWGTGFEEVLDELLRLGLQSAEDPVPPATPTFPMRFRPRAARARRQRR